MSNELLDREIFFSLKEAKTLIARFIEDYNHVRSYSLLDFIPLRQRPVVCSTAS
jgi:hypothetical protein